MKLISKLIFLTILSVTLRCATYNIADPGGEGNGSETVARGVVVDSMGIPLAGIPVHLLPANYNPVVDDTFPEEWRTTSDAKGEYNFNGIDAGTYNVEAGVSSGCMKALVMGIELTRGNEEKDIDTARLQRTGTVTIHLSGMSPRVGDYVYISGTNVYTVITAADSITGKAILRDIPAGTFSDISYVTAIDSQRNNILVETIVVYPGDTLASVYVVWKYSKKIYLNTAGSGADVQEDVYDFPVLIRLDERVFDFSQAKSGGEDIRFVKSDGTPLPYEIERWDSNRSCAEIWVKVDTVRGDNDLQCIVMLWGNSESESESDGGAVFDTSRGFQGVWHLADEGNTTVMDATYNYYHGTPYGMSGESSVVGVVGRSQGFDGVSSRITMLNTSSSKLDISEKGYYCISLWAYADTIDNAWHGIAGKGHQQYYLQYKCFNYDSSSWEFVEYQSQTGWNYSEYFVSPGDNSNAWVYVTGVRDGDKQYLYINGELVRDTVLLNSSAFDRVTEGDFTIGCHLQVDLLPESRGFNYFAGKIDEVRVMSSVPRAEWVKLSYMNQREDNKLVVFR